MGIIKDLTGQHFGKLVAIKPLKERKYHKGGSNVIWLCKCDCGETTKVNSSHLLSGNTKSCGCSRRKYKNSKGGLGKIIYSYKARARKKGIVFLLTDEEFTFLIKQPCYYCGIKLSNNLQQDTDLFKYNGIDRIDNNKGYIKDNCVPCCFICNAAKGEMMIEEFISWIKRIIIHRGDLF